jgi:ssDNA-specific exonuclease RecJ
MINRRIVQTALKRTWGLNKNPGLIPVNPAVDKSSLISQLIYDIFGGEILKTHKKRSWHFYNRINGERIDFSTSEKRRLSYGNHFEDIPASIDEINNYFEQEQYSPFYMRFIREFEETLGLDNFKSVAS